MPLLSPSIRRHGATLLATAAALLLAACGGSTRIDDFNPTRMVTFGDELSLVTAQGTKYSINGYRTDSSVTPAVEVADCSAHEIWTQALARNFGMVYAGLPSSCRPSVGTTTEVALMRAAAGARVADVVAQTQAYTGGYDPQTLVTLQGGLHDVLDTYAAYLAGTLTRPQALAQLSARAVTLASLVDTISQRGAGGRVLYATVPDLGLSPKAIQDQAAGACAVRGEDCRTLLTQLTFRFNEDLRKTVLNDGRYAGVLPIDEYLVTMADVARPALGGNLYGLVNITQPACLPTAALPTCNTKTLVSGATAVNYLWADSVLPGPVWHARVALFAIGRARNNPF